MQHQRAADVHDPLMLCSRLEALIGSAAIEEEVTCITAEISRLDSSLQDHEATKLRFDAWPALTSVAVRSD